VANLREVGSARLAAGLARARPTGGELPRRPVLGTMQPWWPGALVVAVLALGDGASNSNARPRAPETERSASGPTAMRAMPCPDPMIFDNGACVAWPDEDQGAPAAEPESNAHRDKRGRWVSYDQIARRPDRPADYDAYRYPVPCDHACVVSGYDLDRPDEVQRRGRRLHEVGHGAVDLVQPKGTPVTILPLEHQQGGAEVVFVGSLFGTTVITQHMVYEGSQARPYLALFGHLDSAAPGIRPGASLHDGDVIGWVGDTGSPELVHLHFEIRRVRDGLDVHGMGPQTMISNESSVVCDPRNVLPLR